MKDTVCLAASLVILILKASVCSGQTTSDNPKLNAFLQRIAEKHRQDYEAQIKAQNDRDEQARMLKRLDTIKYGVAAATDLIRKNEIEGDVIIGEPAEDTDQQGLNSVKHCVWKFTNYDFHPDKTGAERVTESLEPILGLPTIHNTHIWALIRDVPTDSLLSDQRIFLEVYQVGVVDQGQRRYRVFTASQEKAIEWLKSQKDN